MHCRVSDAMVEYYLINFYLRSLISVELPPVDTVRRTTSQEDKIVKGKDTTGTTNTDDGAESGKAPHNELFYES